MSRGREPRAAERRGAGRAAGPTGRPSESGSPGRLPARGPHRSGRAGLPHPALRRTGCCPSCYLLKLR